VEDTERIASLFAVVRAKRVLDADMASRVDLRLRLRPANTMMSLIIVSHCSVEPGPCRPCPGWTIGVIVICARRRIGRRLWSSRGECRAHSLASLDRPEAVTTSFRVMSLAARSHRSDTISTWSSLVRAAVPNVANKATETAEYEGLPALQFTPRC